MTKKLSQPERNYQAYHYLRDSVEVLAWMLDKKAQSDPDVATFQMQLAESMHVAAQIQKGHLDGLFTDPPSPEWRESIKPEHLRSVYRRGSREPVTI
jgi:hypothetical protein